MRRALVALLPLVATALASAPASAFLCTQTDRGASLFWEPRTVVVRASTAPMGEVTPAEVDEALRFAAAQWSAPDCTDFAFEIGSPTDDRRVGFDWHAGSESDENVNLVVFRNRAPGDPQDDWLHAGSVLALTTVTFLRSTGRIVDADIEMNDASYRFTACDPPECTPEQDLKNTLTHELGHVLGLDHPPPFQPGAEAATMYASAATGDLQKRDLAEDDIDGLCTLYPVGEPPGFCGTQPNPPPPRVTVEEVGCQQTSAGSLSLPAGLLVMLGTLRRRFRREGPEGSVPLRP